MGDDELLAHVMSILQLSDGTAKHGRWFPCIHNDTANSRTQQLHWFRSGAGWPGRAHDPAEPGACYIVTSDNKMVGSGAYHEDRRLQKGVRARRLCPTCCEEFTNYLRDANG